VKQAGKIKTVKNVKIINFNNTIGAALVIGMGIALLETD
jgi:hypothetical protein